MTRSDRQPASAQADSAETSFDIREQIARIDRIIVANGKLREERLNACAQDAGPGLAVTAAIVIARLVSDFRLQPTAEVAFEAGLVGLAALMLLQRHRPARFFSLVVFAFAATDLWRPGLARIEIARSFFGVHQVVDVQTAAGRFHVLYHGTTIHGAERVLEPDGTPVPDRPEPLTYYYFGGPISEGIAAARSVQPHWKNPS